MYRIVAFVLSSVLGLTFLVTVNTPAPVQEQYPAPPSGFLLTPEKLKENLEKDGEPLVSGLVAHRGFHYSNDDMKRPLENTLSAYEHAWAGGVHFCECDVMMTKDGEVVLSHDDNLKRLALKPDQAAKNVRDLSFFKDLEYFPLKDGSRVPRLSEVLAAAKRTGSNSKLIVEIKGTSLECATKVVETALSEQGIHMAAVISFSLESVREFARLNPRKKRILSLLITVRVDKHDGNVVLDLNNFSVLEQTLKDSALDGLVVEYDSTFLTDARFAALCKRYAVGVWGVTKDAKTTVLQLIAKGAKFVDSDLDDEFFHM